MPAFKARKEKRLFEAARRDGEEQRYFDDLGEALESGSFRPSDFSVREVFEEFVPEGREIVSSWNPRHSTSGAGGRGVQLTEAGVDTTAFSNITGQIVYSTVMEAWDDPQFIADELVTNYPTAFNGEKIPGVTGIGDEAEVVDEGGPYPMAGVGEEWIETPQTTKRGFIVPVTKEAVFFDRTGLVLERAGRVTHWLRVNKEKRVLDCALGITTTYKRNGSAAIATYGDVSGAHDWDNLAASNALVDWTDVENAELLFDAIVDPNTGEPVMVMADTLIVPSALKRTAMRVLNATEVRHGDGASATYQTIGANPLAAGQAYRILSNQYVKARTSSGTTWFVGQPKKAFYYMENWGIQSLTAPPNSELEFTNDIIGRFKVTERGVPAVIEPRRMVKCTG